MFEDDRLLGFVVMGVDILDGKKRAYNTGTGVRPSARGKKVVDLLFKHALPKLKDAGIQQCTLEVIESNARAIKVYERIGFGTRKRLKCFGGQLTKQAHDNGITVKEAPFEAIEDIARQFDRFYAWDYTSAAIKIRGNQLRSYQVFDSQQEQIGYFVFSPAKTILFQFETLPGKEDRFSSLLSGVATVSSAVQIRNVDGSRASVVKTLLDAGLENPLDQFEMQMNI